MNTRSHMYDRRVERIDVGLHKNVFVGLTPHRIKIQSVNLFMKNISRLPDFPPQFQSVFDKNKQRKYFPKIQRGHLEN